VGARAGLCRTACVLLFYLSFVSRNITFGFLKYLWRNPRIVRSVGVVFLNSIVLSCYCFTIM